MTKTIKDFADELGVTKQAIQYQLKKINKDELEKRPDGAILITIKVQRLIKENMGIEVEKDQQTGGKSTDKILSDVLLSVLQEELKEKNQQIQQLQKLLEHQQILTLNEQQKNLELEQKEDSESSDSAEQKKEKKKSIINRFFKR